MIIEGYQLISLYQIWVRFFFVYEKSLKLTLKPVFEYKITFWFCVLVLWIHKGYYVVKNLVWNIRIKKFWYTNDVKGVVIPIHFLTADHPAFNCLHIFATNSWFGGQNEEIFSFEYQIKSIFIFLMWIKLH